MTLFKLNFDPMGMLRADTVIAVNKAFNDDLLRNAQRDQAHANKRAMATAVKGGEVFPDDHPFAAEAKLRSMNVDAFADLVLSKPNESGQRELQRQSYLLQVSSAKTPGDIELIKTAVSALASQT